MVQKQILKQVALRKFMSIDDLSINLEVPESEILHLMRLIHQDKPFQSNKIPQEMVEPLLPFFLSESVKESVAKVPRPVSAWQ